MPDRAGPPFDYEEAFSRNLGWVTPAEQQTLRSKRIAIAGLGGVGGAHLLTLARLGIGRFHLADFDRFNAVYERHFPHPRPVRTTVGAVLLDGAKVEITAIARRPSH